jgi:hypothetical protein
MRSRLAASLAFAALVLVAGHTLQAQDPQLPQTLRDRDVQVAELAVEAARRGPAIPIPLSGNTIRAVGVVYDQYLMGVVIARQQMASGQTPDPRAIVDHPNWQSRGTVIVAYPVDCDGRPNRPLAIRWKSAIGGPVGPTPVSDPVRGSAAQSLLPGVSVPNDALVVSMRNAIMAGNASVEIDYAGPVCRGAATTVVLPIATSISPTFGRGVNGVKLPEQFAALPSPSTVRISTTLDATGRARFAEQTQGPQELGPAAIALLTGKTYQPVLINGVAMPLTLTVPVVFTTTGEPGTMAPFVPPPGPPGTFTTSTITRSPVLSTPPPTAAVPPAPPGFLDSQQAKIAIEVAAKGGPVPVPLDAAGPVVHGIVIDRFLAAAYKARAAQLAGTPFDPAAPPADIMRSDVTAIAYPVSCDGRAVAPKELAMSMGGVRPGPMRETGTMLTREELSTRLPGIQLPSGAIGRTFSSAPFSQNLEVRVTYVEPVCGANSDTLTFPIQWTRGQSVPRMSTAKLPTGSSLPSPTQVQMRGTIDLDGAYRFPTIADGPQELSATASTIASAWKFQPYRANGVAIPLSVITQLTFTTSGMPEAPAPVATPPPAGGAPPPPQLMTSSTVGGRSTTDFTTPEVPGLTAATSKCEIATDSAFGQTAGDPIKTGGGFAEGPARERQFLAALRGPAGQGLRIVRLGSTMAPDKTILDLYEITYAGLAAPIRLYLDEYHDGPLKAPQGLVCGSPVTR